MSNKYPKEFYSIGDLIRAARMEKELLQKEVAEEFEVCTLTVGNWVMAKAIPRSSYIPKIKKFVSSSEGSHCILDIGNRIKAQRLSNKMTQVQMSRLSELSLNTDRRVELGSLSVYPKTFEKVISYLKTIPLHAPEN